MLSESQVRKRLKGLLYKYLSKKLDQELKQRPQNCRWNSSHQFIDVTSGKTKDIGICMYSTVNPGIIDTDICDTASTAMACPCFELRKNKEQVKQDFFDELKDETLVNLKYRDIRELKLILGDQNNQLTWWQRFKLRFKPTKIKH